MSKKEFHTYDDVFDWLYAGMHKGQGMYYYKRRNINFRDKILVMFQYNNEVIATAIMINEEKFDDLINGYGGIYYFDINSILILEKTISKYDIQQIDGTFKNFSQASTIFNKNTYPDLINLISERAISLNNDIGEYTSITTSSAYEGKKLQIYTTKYERNPKNRLEAIKLHGTKCQVCGFDFYDKYGELGKGFIEVHHIKPLHTFDEEIEVNPETDLVCLCSNCHKMIHRKKKEVLSVEKLKSILDSRYK